MNTFDRFGFLNGWFLLPKGYSIKIQKTLDSSEFELVGPFQYDTKGMLPEIGKFRIRVKAGHANIHQSS